MGKKIADNNHQLVFSSNKSECFGYFIRSGLNSAHSIKAHILGTVRDGGLPGQKNKKPSSSCLFSEDSILVIQIPDDGFSNEGFSRACNWLHHQTDHNGR
jgi:hypothetical protein